MRYAIKIGVPVVAFKDSGGARIQEGVDALSGYGDVFYANVLLSGVVPQIAIICGPCAGGAAYSPALMDFVIMTRKNSQMFLTGPEVIKAVTGRTTTLAEIGSAEMHASVSGNAHFIAEDDQHAISLVKHLLTFLPSNNTEDPPHNLAMPIESVPDQGINDLIPANPAEPIDMQAVIRRLVDNGELFEVHATFARNVIVGFARFSGVVVGVVANQPMHMAGALDLKRGRQGRALRPYLQRLQHPARHAGGRPRLPARCRTGTRRHHSPRRQDAARLRLLHDAEDHGHPAASPTAVPTSPCAARNSAPTSSTPGRPPKSR